MKSARSIIEEIWNYQLENLPKGDKGPAVIFQTNYNDQRTEYRACRRCVMIDYSPIAQLNPTELYAVPEHTLITEIDEQRIAPERFLHEEFLNLADSALLTNRFLPFKNESHAGLYALDKDNRDCWKKRYELDALKEGPFSLIGLNLYEIPAWCKSCIYGHSSLVALHAQFGLTRNGNVPTLLLSSDSSLLIVTLNRVPMDENPIIILEGDEKLQFDGYIEKAYAWSRLIPKKENKKKMSKGLPNPTKRAVPAAAPAVEPETVEAVPQNPVMVHAPVTPPPAPEPQVEEVQPEQAKEIAQEAPAAVDPVAPEKEKPRRRNNKVAAQDSDMLKTMDALAEYLGCPVPDTMTVPQIEEELRHCRELGLALTRRMANLGLAGTTASSKLIGTIRGLVG